MMERISEVETRIANLSRIAETKKQAQELVRYIQSELCEAKQELKVLMAEAKPGKAKSANQSLDLLKKLKEAKDAGLLTEAEFDLKRKKLVDSL
ncbi:MAG: SHOCT domain-containing protein [Methylococcaceae bacterium]